MNSSSHAWTAKFTLHAKLSTATPLRYKTARTKRTSRKQSMNPNMSGSLHSVSGSGSGATLINSMTGSGSSGTILYQGPTFYFVMIGTKDNPIYEAEFPSSSSSRSTSAVIPESKREEARHLNQFIAHSALDMVEDIQWTTNQMYLKSVDKFNDRFISAFLTAGNIKLLLLHDAKSEDAVRNFFNETYELYIKNLLNPFYEPNSIITSTVFDTKVRLIAKRYL